MEVTDNTCQNTVSFSDLWRCLWNSNFDIQELENNLSYEEYNELAENFYRARYLNSPSNIFEETDEQVQEDILLEGIETLYEEGFLQENHCNNMESTRWEQHCKSLF